MSGPITPGDVPPTAGTESPAPPCVEVLEGRRAEVGGTPVTRLLPKRARRTIGAWCFVDHFGPAEVADAAMQIGPHPHIGLHTVTWLLAGELVHRDSVGSEQPIRPGQLNLMTAGRGVSHAEETPAVVGGVMHGVQLWVAQPEATRFGAPAFEHHAAMPQVELGAGTATVLVGALDGIASPARADTPLIGADVVVGGGALVPLDPGFEHGVVVLEGRLGIDGRELGPGVLAYLGRGRDELDLAGRGRALLLGGAPFEAPVRMWWNFVARTQDELDEARRAWEAGDSRFGTVASSLPRVPAPPL